MWREYLPGRPYHAFAFVSDVRQGPVVQWVCYILTGVALAVCLVRRRQPICMMLLGATIGHLASVPFAPSRPWRRLEHWLDPWMDRIAMFAKIVLTRVRADET